MEKIKITLVALFLSFSAFSQTEQPTPIEEATPSPSPVPVVTLGKVVGKILEKGTKKPLPDVSVYFLPHQLKAVTDKDGSFSIELPLGISKIVVNVADYNKLEKDIVLQEGKSFERNFYLERTSYQGDFETVVVGKKYKKDPSQKSLSQKQFETMPGAGGDPVKAVANLPGINRSAGFNSNVIIQGAGLLDTRYLIDGHEVPFLFHFGALSTVVFPEAIESVDYFSAGYGPQYSRALGGIVGLNLRSPRTDRWRGLAFVDLFNAGGLIEGGSGDHGFLFSFRQSYIGEVLSAIIGNRESFNFTLAPRYTDATALYDYKIDADNKFKVTAVGSLDAVEFLVKNPVSNDPFLRGKFKNETKFFRIIPQYSSTLSEDLSTDVSLGFGWTDFTVETDENYLLIRTWSVTPRNEWKWAQNDRIRWTFGTDNRLFFTNADVRLPNDYAAGGVFNPLASSEEVSVNVFGFQYDMGFYSSAAYTPKDTAWTLTPGVRVDYFSSTKDLFADPRMAIAYNVAPGFTLRTQGGLYHQPPEPRESNSQSGNPDLNTPRAWHLSADIDNDFRKGSSTGFTTTFGTFFRWFDDIVTRSNQLVVRNGNLVPEYYNSSTKGFSYGGESLVRYTNDRWNLALAYTILKSTRTEPIIGTYSSPYDQTHNLNFIAAVDLPRNWKISTRVRYVTGNPYTPIVDSSFDADKGVFIPTRGKYYSDRLDHFLQADVRVDKKWIFDRWILSLYLDLQNALNRKNPETINYAYDFKSFTTTSGLPLYPSLGLKGEF